MNQNDVAAPENVIDFETFKKVQLRVGQIDAAEAVPDSRKLVRLQVNLGPALGRRQIVAGILPYYDPASLIGRKIVVVANLKPAKLMGNLSEGMLLAAVSQDGSSLCLVDPGAEMQPGFSVC